MGFEMRTGLDVVRGKTGLARREEEVRDVFLDAIDQVQID